MTFRHQDQTGKKGTEQCDQEEISCLVRSHGVCHTLGNAQFYQVGTEISKKNGRKQAAVGDGMFSRDHGCENNAVAEIEDRIRKNTFR